MSEGDKRGPGAGALVQRRTLLRGLAAGVVSAALMPAKASAAARADRVVVRKSQRKVELYRGETILRSYDCSLGLSPTGHKQREGDFRTPEGNYYLDTRNFDSDFFLSIRISYPNDQDFAWARQNGVNPGNYIMIHGLPNQMDRPQSYYRTHDWTNGCVAVSNADIVEIWMLTDFLTPIDILA
ncbi:MAG: L,D-transpeptidase family protein [Gammaproteobacteria bacterium]|nr:L,D-transpeptidase family protein [Gammaproteobacteria bacterium]